VGDLEWLGSIMYRQHCQHLMEHQPKSRDFGSRRVTAAASRELAAGQSVGGSASPSDPSPAPRSPQTDFSAYWIWIALYLAQ